MDLLPLTQAITWPSDGTYLVIEVARRITHLAKDSSILLRLRHKANMATAVPCAIQSDSVRTVWIVHPGHIVKCNGQGRSSWIDAWPKSASIFEPKREGVETRPARRQINDSSGQRHVYDPHQRATLPTRSGHADRHASKRIRHLKRRTRQDLPSSSDSRHAAWLLGQEVRRPQAETAASIAGADEA